MANNTVKLAVEEATKKTTAGDGRIVRIIGPVVDVKFDGAVPPIYNALTVEAETPIGHLSTILEVESQLPGGVVRTVAMSSTDGLQRGLIATDTGEPMKMPVGPKTLGRIWNVMGKPVDGKPMPEVEEFYPIHHAAPRFDELMPPESIVYFNDQEDLLGKIREFHHDDAKRRLWAARARDFFQTEINSRLNAQYIVEASLMQRFTHDYVWAQDINLDGSQK